MSRRAWTVFFLVLCIVGMAPVVLSGLWIHGVDGITVQQARTRLAQTLPTAVLVDVRSSAAYADGHLEGAVNWPHDDIASATEPPAELRGRQLILVCDSGLLATQAARRLNVIAVVRGGMESYIRAGKDPACLCNVVRYSGAVEGLPSRPTGRAEQSFAVLAAYVVKPAYMLLAAALLVVLRGRRAPDLVALRLGLAAFLVGEGFCAFNYLLLGDISYLVEYLHSLGMALAFGGFAYALLEGLDARLVKYSSVDERCSALALCHGCSKYGDHVCGLVRLFQALSLFGLLLCIAPFCVDPRLAAYNTTIWGTPYTYSHAVVYQLFELRYCPLIGAAFFLASWMVLRRGRGQAVPVAKVLFATASGFLGFGLFRFFLLFGYEDRLIWFVAWEEFTELLAIGLIGYVVWVFRHGLLAVSLKPAR